LASLRMAVSQLLSAHFVHEDAHMANVLWASRNKSTKTLNDCVEMRQDIRNGVFGAYPQLALIGSSSPLAGLSKGYGPAI
jgi:hypothetical protein